MPPRSPLGWIVASYAIAAGCWIYLSDHALHRIGDPQARLFLSLYKGWFFVALTSLLLALLLRRYHLQISRHRAELDRHASYSDALSAVNQAIVASTDSGELYRRVCQALVAKGGFVLAWTAVLDARRIVPAASAGPAAFLDGLEAHVAEGSPVARAVQDGHLVAVERLQAGATAAAWQLQAHALGLQAVAAMPFRQDGVVVGALCLGTAADTFHPRELALLREAAADIGFALEQLARGKRLQHALEELQREHLYSEMLLESMPGVVYFHDREGRFLRWNRHLAAATGYGDAELTQLGLPALFRAEDHPLLEARIGAVFEDGEATLEAPLRDRAGELAPYFFTCRRISFGGRDCVIGVGLDVSVRRAAEEALRRSEERHRSTLDSILEGCQIIGHDWTYLYLNESAERHNRRPKEELLGRRVLECWPGMDATQVFADMRRCMLERQGSEQQVEFTFPDGSIGWFQVQIQPVPEGIIVLSLELTEQRLAEARLRRKDALLRIAGRIARFGGWSIDTAGQHVDWTEQVYELLRQSRELPLAPERLLENLTPAGREVLATALQRCRELGEPFDLEVGLDDDAEAGVWLRVSGEAERDRDGRVVRIQGAIQDISQTRHAHEALRRSEERFREMADNMGEVFFHYDLRSARLRYAGPAFERLYGEAIAGLYQEPARYIAALRAPLSETLANLPPGASVESQHRIARGGEQRWIHEHAVPVRDALGSIERIVGILRDVTDSRNAQAAQQQLLVDLRARNQELQEFAFVASHDLQEPLRKIRAFSDLLTSRHADALAGEARQYVDRMQSAAERMQGLIDALLAYSRVAAGARALEDVDLAVLLREVWADLEPRVLATGAELRHAPLPVLKADPTQMRQIFQNLLANALKFRDSQRAPSIRIDCTQIELDGRPAWQLCFADNGIGFDPRHADRIFAPFHRLHSRSEYEGTGMGLAIVRRIVERHGGRIEAHAEVGVGARFTVTLPA